MKKTLNSRVFSQERFMVGSERFWPANCGLDSYFLQAGHPIHGPLDVDAKYIPIKLKEAEGKRFFHVIKKGRVNFVASDVKSVALKF